MREFSSYLADFSRVLAEDLSRIQGPCREAACYAIEGGKRLRPILTLLIADSLGYREEALKSALSVEYFHTASLILDDLPCMDNDLLRRGRKTVHAAFGESTAVLTAFGLIVRGFELVKESSEDLQVSKERTTLALDMICKQMGFSGAIAGQFFDLALKTERLSEIIDGKTASGFIGAVALGWIFGRGDMGRLPEVERMGGHLGRAFQLCDDLIDASCDSKRDVLNYALVYGRAQTEQEVEKELASFAREANSLCIPSAFTEPVVGLLLRYPRSELALFSAEHS